jgi:hypothetical protein
MNLDILGIGTAVPEHFILQEDAAHLASCFVATEGRRERALRALYRRTGVSKRHSVMLEANEGRPACVDTSVTPRVWPWMPRGRPSSDPGSRDGTSHTS